MPLASDRNTPYRKTDILALPVAAGAIIRAGALVALNAAGQAAPGTASATLIYAGRAEETVDNTTGANGDKTVQVRRKKAFKWLNLVADAITSADLLKTCYIVDDQTVARTSAANTRSVAGVVVGIDVDGVWVE